MVSQIRQKRGVVSPPHVRNVRRTFNPNFEHPRTLHLSPKPHIQPPEHHHTLPRYPTREKYSCIDFLDPESGILGLFGFLLPIFLKNWYFFSCFLEGRGKKFKTKRYSLTFAKFARI